MSAGVATGVAQIDVERLSFRYADGTEALRDVSVRVDQGEIVAVLGPSGAGKSTLFRCLAGLENATEGTVRLAGADLAELRGTPRRRTLARIGLVFQEFHLVGQLSVLKNVLIGRIGQSSPLPTWIHVTSGADRALAVELIARVGLTPQLRKRADALSGGQRQRVALARALAQEPDLLLADEPVANLDPVLAAGVVDDIVRMVRENGLTAVLNLHDVALARRVAPRIIGMRHGRKLFDLPTDQVTDMVLDELYGGDGPDQAPAVVGAVPPQRVAEAPAVTG